MDEGLYLPSLSVMPSVPYHALSLSHFGERHRSLCMCDWQIISLSAGGGIMAEYSWFALLASDLHYDQCGHPGVLGGADGLQDLSSRVLQRLQLCDTICHWSYPFK